MDDLPLQNIAISAPTLASLLYRFSSAPGDVDGLLFGDVSQVLPSNLTDDDSPSAPSEDPPSVVAAVTGFFCFASTALPSYSFYHPNGRLRLSLLGRTMANRDPRASLLGWFSGRRRTPPRPSMREFCVSLSLSEAFQSSFPMKDASASFKYRPSVFVLLSTPLTDQTIHTHEFRAYQYSSSTGFFNPKSMNIVNLGPIFRGHYGGFSATSPFPTLYSDFRGSNSAMAEDRDEGTVNDETRRQDQRELDMCAEGFELSNLSRLVGSEASNYTSGLENLYEKMLKKLEGLAREVEKTSAKVLEQENRYRGLRNR